MECKRFHDTSSKAHNMVSTALFDAARSALPAREEDDRGFEFHVEKRMEQLFPATGGSPIGRFQPDAMYIDHDKKRIIILEFTRGMTEDDLQWAFKVDQKIAAYHGCHLYLLRTQRGYNITQHTYVMGILTSIDEKLWREQLQDLGVPERDTEKVLQATMGAAIDALHMSLNARMAAKEELGLRDDTPPSQRPRPPD